VSYIPLKTLAYPAFPALEYHNCRHNIYDESFEWVGGNVGQIVSFSLKSGWWKWVVKVGCLGEGQGHLPMIMMMAILHAQKPAQVSSSLGSSSCVLHLSPWINPPPPFHFLAGLHLVLCTFVTLNKWKCSYKYFIFLSVVAAKALRHVPRPLEAVSAH